MSHYPPEQPSNPYTQYPPQNPYAPPQPVYTSSPYGQPQSYYQVQYSAPQVTTVQEPGSTAALLGFIFSLVGTFVFSPLLVASLILSIIGLKSRSRHGLALAGLIISIIAMVIWVILIIVIIGAIAAASTTPHY